ncbi:hypothetical protein NDU88_005363 [Pleurodeles waltl]|uniref:Uncharacterized protein n=1 Tax=Pleurodeles waltl TaxID=8319 RepID=A0AAV7VN45_PLEWA|nr:hypothetical protein NDU88_005363 [Pleurodeles waltl]
MLQCDSSVFYDKVASIDSNFPKMARAAPCYSLWFQPLSDDAELGSFKAIELTEMLSLVEPVKSSSADDPTAPEILERGMSVIALLLCDLLNSSLETVRFPRRWKHAMVMTLLKKPGLDTSKRENFRPLSPLPFISRVAEKWVNQQLAGFIETKDLLLKTQCDPPPP